MKLIILLISLLVPWSSSAGTFFDPSSPRLTQDRLEILSRRFLAGQAGCLRLNVDDLKVRSQGISSPDVSRGKNATGRIQFQQFFQGMLVWGGSVTVLFQNDRYDTVINNAYPIDRLSNVGEGHRELEFQVVLKKVEESAKTRGYFMEGQVPTSKDVAVFPMRGQDRLSYRESLGTVAYVLVEFQIVDEKAALDNNSGENSHESYKKRQKAAVIQRLMAK